MLIPRFVVSIFSAGMLVLGAHGASGQVYPNKPIRIVVSSPGSANDFMARLIAQGIAKPLGQPVIVENRGSGFGPQDTVAKGIPDGYTAIISGSSLWVAALTQIVPYDPVKDYEPITLLVKSPLLLVVTTSLPVKSVKELIGMAKAKPGELNYSTGGPGGSAHLAAELFNSMAGVKIVHVPYSSINVETQDLIAGRVQMTIRTVPAVIDLVRSGRLRGLAVTSLEPSPLAPDFPTLATSLPGYQALQTNAMLAPAKTPAAIIKRLNQEVVRVINQADVKEKFFNVGLEVVGSTPEELAAWMSADIALWSKVIKDAGIKVE